MKRFFLVGALVALFLTPATAQDAASEFDSLASGSDQTEAPQAANLGTLKWSGVQEFAWRWGAAENPSRTGPAVDSTLAAEYKWEDLKIVGSGLVRNNEFVPGETLVQWAPDDFKLSAGWTEFSWGVADANNPTDTLNARDYRFGANAARLVNPAVTLAWYPAEWVSLEAVYEPWKETSKFPNDFAAKLRSQFAASGTLVTAFDDPHDGTKPVWGGRANLYLSGWDLSASYILDRDTYYTPVFTLVNAGVYVPSKIDLVRKSVQRVGLNVKTTVDRFGLWFEGAYNLTEDPTGTDKSIRDNKLAWTTGFDFNWGPASTYYVNLQYAGSWSPTLDPKAPALTSMAQLAAQPFAENYYYRNAVDSLGAETEASLHGLTYSFKFPIEEILTPSLSGAVMVPVGYDDTAKTRVASVFFKPEIDLIPADGVHVLLGADLAYGWVKSPGSSDIVQDTTTDKLGVYTPQNNVYIKVQYKWNGSLGN